MKPRILVLAVLSVIGAGCSTTADKQHLAYRIEPVQTIRHGAPSAPAYYQLGRYYQGQNRLAQAEDAYQKAIAADDRYIDAFNALASLFAQRGETERAAKMFERLTAIAPDAAYLHNNLGYAYYLLGRQDEAYVSVKKALTLDGALERGWSNLEKIALKTGDSLLLAAVHSHALAALPPTLGAPAAVVLAKVEETQEPARAQAPSMPVREAGFTVVTTPTRLQIVEEIQTSQGAAEVSGSGVAESAPFPARAPASSDAIVASTADSGRVRGGDFFEVSAPREMVVNDGLPETGMPVARRVALQQREPRPVELPSFRLEVSNGNGVPRFANGFSSLLREHRLAVARITNHANFTVKQTIVEFQPGYESVAQLLTQRTNLDARLVLAARPRTGVDVRIVLGKDAVPLRKFEYNTADAALTPVQGKG